MRIVYSVIRQVLGWTLLVLGLVATLIPVLPQIPFLIAGALLLAPYIRVFKRASAWLHRKYPQHRPHMRHFRIFKIKHQPKENPPPQP